MKVGFVSLTLCRPFQTLLARRALSASVLFVIEAFSKNSFLIIDATRSYEPHFGTERSAAKVLAARRGAASTRRTPSGYSEFFEVGSVSMRDNLVPAMRAHVLSEDNEPDELWPRESG